MTTESVDVSAGIGGLTVELAEAEAALAAFARGPARAAADDISDAFARAGRRIASSLGAAAGDGESSMKRLAKIILEELARVALARLLPSIGGSLGGLPFLGARAAGGSVTRGGAYLVGERGPEWFTPASTGAVSAPPQGPVSVHFHLSGGDDGHAIMRHQGQIAAQIARAVAYGRRNL